MPAQQPGIGLLQAEQADCIPPSRHGNDMCGIPLGWGIALLAGALKDTNYVCKFELQDSRPGGNPGTKPKLAGRGAHVVVRLTRNIFWEGSQDTLFIKSKGSCHTRPGLPETLLHSKSYKTSPPQSSACTYHQANESPRTAHIGLHPQY